MVICIHEKEHELEKIIKDKQMFICTNIHTWQNYF